MPLVNPLPWCELDGHSDSSGGMVARSFPNAPSAALVASSAGLGSSRRPFFPALTSVGVVRPIAPQSQVAGPHAQHFGSPTSGEHQGKDDGTVTQADRRVWDYGKKLVDLVCR